MKIAVISHLYPNRSHPASGTFIRSYFLGLSKLFDSEMVVPTVRAIPFTKKWSYTHSPFITEGEAVRLRYLSFPGGRFPHLVTRTISHAVTAYLKHQKPDLVHVHWLYPDGLAIPAIRKSLDVPVVLSIHGSDWYNTRNRPKLRELLERSLFAADKILTVGTRLKKDIQHALPELEERLMVTYNPIDFGMFAPAESRESAMRSMNWDPTKKHLLCVANISHEKGVDVLLDAMEMLQMENLLLHIIGNVPDSPYSRSIISRISRSDHILLHPPASHDTIPDYFKACDLLVMPSRREGFGIAAAEAIACGKPVIATKSGGPEDILTKDNGLLVDVDSPGQIADAVRQILAGRTGLQQETIRSSIKKKFDSEKIIHDIGRMYESTIHSGV
ncbi:glycosyltransferase [Balneolales bacterium ANBcel1]|nr:glycosyltransferase [Balneolales bacterium ANBcel1]